jgi:radical SAM superfamily enzyme YgiQ (UPF0313 family)
LETKRGCPRDCSFCAHKGLQGGRVFSHPRSQVFGELALFKEKSVRKINVVDPLFNCGSDYLEILKECLRINLDCVISLQTDFSSITGSEGEEFLELCSSLNVVLECGVETIHANELAVLNKANDPVQLGRILRRLREYEIGFEVNLLYGLPLQTVDSFRSSIEFLLENGCTKIRAFPLTLLSGTQLENEKERWGCKEDFLGLFHLPLVVSSNSFDRDDWQVMKRIAGALKRKCRRTNATRESSLATVPFYGS